MRTLLALFFCASLTGATRADPGPVVRWLMNEPASLFDVGIMRINNRLNGIQEALGDQIGYPIALFSWYDWEQNRIFIEGRNQSPQPREDVLLFKLNARKACGVFFASVRYNAGMRYVGKNLMLPDDKASIMANQFGHDGYTTSTEPTDYAARIDRIFVIRFEYTEESGNSESKGRKYICEAPLLDTGFTVKEETLN
ncbi:hypothetical protein [Denitrobaculum tricleocarpae]|uniref:Uncharacterized protein n=1 Tax=Denitrobaculum tricleocarpae TaxID=2591009 RepID=A0A545TT07_9PROT|nr:hypothetical protein [Denitrobaculum tricleocarpae]TQV80346.1 hypothetical protein FKG95_09125 [Denitrobaculum tricleocarpae]